jgi:hypothetical protein
MRHTDHRGQLEVEIETKECDLPADELARIQEPLDQIGQAVGDLPARLNVTIVYHPRSQRYHVEAAVRLPRRSLFTGEWDGYLDAALLRSLRKLMRKIEAYKEEPDRDADVRAQRVEAMNRDIVAPQDPAVGPLAEASAAGDYRRFRHLLGDYEEWLRLRVGRWLQRYPAANAELGRRLAIGDLVEEVFLNAFEHFQERPTIKPLHEWLDELIDPSLQALLHDAVEERESVSQARSVRELPVS